jgi:Cu-Zn family superoxide dismutase
MNEDSRSTVGRWTARVAAPIGAAAAIALVATGIASATRDGASWTGTPDTAAPAAAPVAEHRPREVSTVLKAADGTAIGTVRFRRKSGHTVVQAKVTLPPGLTAMGAFHGFHVHANNKPENGDGCQADPTQPASTWFVSADGHLAEPGQTHSHHTGDMPSLLVNSDGTTLIEFSTERIDLADLVGRAVVLHAQPDNFGQVPTGSGADQYTANSGAATDKTAATGNAGDRIACGVLILKR